jgi:hypothetical protein
LPKDILNSAFVRAKALPPVGLSPARIGLQSNTLSYIGLIFSYCIYPVVPEDIAVIPEFLNDC